MKADTKKFLIAGISGIALMFSMLTNNFIIMFLMFFIFVVVNMLAEFIEDPPKEIQRTLTEI